jgi:hypothetical protein
VAGIPLSHTALTRVLAGDPDQPPRSGPTVLIRPGELLAPARLQELRQYLAVLARGGPAANPELFPTDRDALAYLLNAHIGWALLLNVEPTLRGADSATIRRTPFPLARTTRTLESLEVEILQRWSTEPRVALLLNPGWRGGPPLPPAALESFSVPWQIAQHATECGRTSSFWSFDAKGKSLAVSAFTGFMPGLPPEPARRTRRLLDLVPPPEAMRNAVLDTCGDFLQRCSITFQAVDERRL